MKMMILIEGIIILTIINNGFVVCGDTEGIPTRYLNVYEHGQAGATEITVDEYLGTWYDVGVIFPRRLEPSPVLCQWVESTPADADDDIEEVLTVISRRLPPQKYTAFGKIFGSTLELKYSKSKESTITYEAITYNNGYEMILRDNDDLMSSVLMSRNTTASTEAITVFEKLAEEAHGFAHFIDNSECFP
uniref:Uncharacterized protein n=1 Tax=Meteorus pulchricornis TaxID=51522 RepID=H7CHJ5_9HYME|nr:hypothetical protein [Meteorus pulchricornis]